MSQLEDMMSQQKDMVNRGYQIDQIQCAALMLIAASLPDITFELASMREQLVSLEMSCRGTN